MNTELNKGDLIRIPQYENTLRVNFAAKEDVEMYGIEFADKDKQTNAMKSIMVNKHSGKPYLIAGRYDKGEIKTIEKINES